MAVSRAQAVVEMELGFIMADSCRLLRKEVDRRVRHTGLSRLQWLLLAHIERRPGCNLTLLAERLQKPAGTLARVAGSMEHAGWVIRKDDGYYLTPQGTNLNAEVKGPAQTLLEECFHGLPPERRKAFVRDLGHIRANLLWLATDRDERSPASPGLRRV